MEQQLISKKELLELTGISYGQLYRWKRKGLIPEEWFIKKPSYTGQETFFPRSYVLARIEKIKSLKEDASLDDLADVFSPESGNISLCADEAVSRGIASDEIMRIYIENTHCTQALDFNDLLYVSIFCKLLDTGRTGLNEAKEALDVLRTANIQQNGMPSKLCLARKLGIFFCFAASFTGEIYFDQRTCVIETIDIQAAVEELKSILL